MPNRQTHKEIGTASGAISAAYCARMQQPFELILEAIGGGLGGCLGGVIPDVFDPATSPNHRSIAHGILPTGSAMKLIYDQLPVWQQKLRELSVQYETTASQEKSYWRQALDVLLAMLCRIAAGAIVGFPAGYLSHLVADMFVPSKGCKKSKGLPLIMQGF